MIFLKDSDFDRVVKTDIKSYLGNADTTELYAIDVVKTYLSNYYDLDKELAETDGNRSPILIGLILDLVIYQLYSKLAPNQIPDMRVDRFNNTMQMLNDATKNIITLPLEKKDNIEVSGVQATNHYLY